VDNIKVKLISNTEKETLSQLEFTGIVVTYNEEKRLRDCLNSLAFCEQLIVIDLGSTDSSVEIAKNCGAEIKHHARVPVVEQIRQEAIGYSKNDWIVFLDPDEVLPTSVEDELISIIRDNPKVGVIKIPWQFYFKGKPFYFTVWGTKKTKGFVFHRNRNKFYANVHRGSQLLLGYESAALPQKDNFIVKHYWFDSYIQLFEKHWRYIKKEGEVRFKEGKRFSLLELTKSTVVSI